jgi:hypothetical protein
MRTSCSNFLGLTTSSRAARAAWRSRYSWWRTSFLQGTAAGTAGVRQHTRDTCPDVSGTQAQASALISSAPQPLHQQRVLLAETQEKATPVLSWCLVAYVQPRSARGKCKGCDSDSGQSTLLHSTTAHARDRPSPPCPPLLALLSEPALPCPVDFLELIPLGLEGSADLTLLVTQGGDHL